MNEDVKMKKLLQIALAASVLVFGNVQAETPADGMQAFKKGEYQTALRLLVTEADNGSTDALYALGLMHEYGLGVESSASQAASYYFKGAKIATRQNRLAQARIYVNAIERTVR